MIASLVRSNKKGSVGFLGEPERINVLLSRARHGLIMLGNTSTLKSATSTAARKHWGAVLNLLERKGNIRSGLPAKCQLHDTLHVPDLGSPAAFSRQSPDGGCTLPCTHLLRCGHRCTLRCHAFDREHEAVQCKEQVYSYCSEGHLILHQCSTLPKCKTCEEVRFKQNAGMCLSLFDCVMAVTIRDTQTH